MNLRLIILLIYFNIDISVKIEVKELKFPMCFVKGSSQEKCVLFIYVLVLFNVKNQETLWFF